MPTPAPPLDMLTPRSLTLSLVGKEPGGRFPCQPSTHGLHYACERQAAVVMVQRGTPTAPPSIFLTPRRGESPTDARFTTAGWPTAPRGICPARKMFMAGLWSRSAMNPQKGQTWVRLERRFSTRSPHAEQSCDVYCGATTITCFSAHAALCSSVVRNDDHPASLMLLARWGGVRTRVATRRSSREIVSS